MRTPGLSAVLRVKNEEEYIVPCLQSITDWFDEIVVVDQASTDRTLELVRDVADGRKTRIFEYPYQSRPNGPGFDTQPYDEHSRAAFYDWALARTTRTWAAKWDGDMVAFDVLGELVRDVVDSGRAEAIAVCGVDIVMVDIVSSDMWTGPRFLCATEPRFFTVRNGRHWAHGSLCEQFLLGDRSVETINQPTFLHMKWAKPLEKATQAWPPDWRNIGHFRQLIKRRDIVRQYDGPLPACLKTL